MKRKKRNLVASTRLGSVLLVGSVLGLLAGCGDAHTFKTSAGHIDPSSISSDHACFDGSAIELTRYSSACARMSASLTSEVYTGMVFSADEVRTLRSPCADGPSPGFDVIFDGDNHSILFDFSQVARGGRFPEAGFEGYIFDVALEEANGSLLGVVVDSEVSSLDVDAGDLEWNYDHIEVNLEGVRYDDQRLLKLDLIFARVSPVSG